MDALIRTITNTLLRGTLYKGIRRLGVAPTVALFVIAAVVTILTR